MVQQVPDNAAGQKMPCVKCGQRLKVPEPAGMRTVAGVLASVRPAFLKPDKQWFYLEGGQPVGPLTWADLRRMATTGELNGEARVWGEGMAEWKPAKAVPNLFAKPAAKTPEAPASGGSGNWLEGLGVLFFGGLTGIAILLLIGFFVWKGVRQTPAVAVSSAAAPTSGHDGAADRALEPKEIFAQCSPSVARVQVAGWTGSGFLAKPGIVVTNSHVIAPGLANKIRVTFPSAPGGNAPLIATLLHEDRTRDLAILRIENKGTPIPLAEGDCPRGEKIVVIGSPGRPDGDVVENAVTGGELSASVQKDDLNWYQISAAINGGNSGGPVFNTRGQVIGVATWSWVNKQAMNYAVPSADILTGIQRAQARSVREVDQVAAEHDAALAYSRLGKATWLCVFGMAGYSDARTEAARRSEDLDTALQRVTPRMNGIVKGLKENLDKSFNDEILPHTLANKALPESIRGKIEALRALLGEAADWVDNPKRDKFEEKTQECDHRLGRIFTQMRHELGLKRDPRPDPDEVTRWGLAD
jgi:S1-C subfamily serine protease